MRKIIKSDFFGYRPKREYIVYETTPRNLLFMTDWGCQGILIGDTSEEIGTGLDNSQKIVESCGTSNIAAKWCLEYSLNGFDDWFLPSKNELEILLTNNQLVPNLSTVQGYWSSTEDDEDNAYNTFISVDGEVISVSVAKSGNRIVRPVRTYITENTPSIGQRGVAGGYIFHFEETPARKHTLTIYDRTLPDAGSPQEVILETPGYAIDYYSGVSNISLGGVMESEVGFVICNIDGIIDLFLGDLSVSGDKRYLVEISIDDEPEWRGVLLQDFSTLDDSPYQKVGFKAVDGLSFLQNMNVPDIPSNRRIPLLWYIIDGLKNIPSVSFFDFETELVGGEEFVIPGTDMFLKVKTDWYAEGMDEDDEPLEKAFIGQEFFLQSPREHFTVIKTEIGYNGQEVITKEPMNYRDILQHILRRFNAVLVMQKGFWYITQRHLLRTPEFQTYNCYTKRTIFDDIPWEPQRHVTKPTEVVRNTISINHADFRYRSRGSFSYLPGLNSVKTKFYGGDLVGGFDSLLPANYGVGTYTTIPVEAGEDNFLHIRVSFKEQYNIPNMGSQDQEVIRGRPSYRIQVEVGGWYLRPEGYWVENPVWIQWDSTEISNFVGLIGTPANAYADWTTVYFNRISQAIPADGEVTVRLERVGVQTYQGPPISDTPLATSFTAETQNHFLFYIKNNQNPIATATYMASGQLDEHTIDYELEDAMFDSAGITINGNTTLYPLGQKWRDTWDVEQSSGNYYFNELLVRQLLSAQARPLLTFMGDIWERNNIHIRPLMGLVLMDTMFIVGKATFTASEERWAGDWIELKALQSRDVHESTPILEEVQDIQLDVFPGKIPSWPLVRPDVIELPADIIQDVPDFPKPTSPGGLIIGGHQGQWHDAIDSAKEDNVIGGINQNGDLVEFRPAVGIVINAGKGVYESMTGVKSIIANNETMKIPSTFQYNSFDFTVLGEIDNEGDINLLE